MSDEWIEHKIMKYLFFASSILVGVFYIWWVDDIQVLIEVNPWFKWLPLFILLINGILCLFSYIKLKPENQLIDSLSMLHLKIMKENGDVNYMQVVEQGSASFTILVTYNEGSQEEFKVKQRKIISRSKV